MNFTEDAIGAATSGAQKLRKAYDAAKSRPAGDSAAVRERFLAALDDDMNTAGALGVLFDGLASIDAALFEEALGVLGVGDILTREVAVAAIAEVDPASIERLRATLSDVVSFNGESPAGIVEHVIDARNAARKARDFALADRLRNALSAEGIVLTDGKDGSTTWTVGGA